MQTKEKQLTYNKDNDNLTDFINAAQCTLEDKVGSKVTVTRFGAGFPRSGTFNDVMDILNPYLKAKPRSITFEQSDMIDGYYSFDFTYPKSKESISLRF